jgi:hypothetical protein
MSRARQRIGELERRLDYERLYPTEWANRRVRDGFGDVIQAGPFRGLGYPDWAMTQVDAYSPKILGSFEMELHRAVEAAIARAPRTVVNVGAAEGYYAVGMALRLPDARVVAYEPREAQADRMRAIAELNEAIVEIVVAPCTPALLGDVVEAGALVLCDCDGCEAGLLDPAVTMGLGACDLIIETHDLWEPGITDLLESRFRASHDVERIDTVPRFVQDFPQLDFMPLVTRQLAIIELREGPQCWLVMRPHAKRT